MLTVNGFSTGHILSTPEFLEAMTSDFIANGANVAIALKKLLTDIRTRLRRDGKELEDFGLQYEPGTTNVVVLDDTSDLQQHKETQSLLMTI